ncbi:MAG: hemolysin family protein [Lachnospiraceae bacterium]|nr:hemolysin family protein [Lachnospiraceae bacterium]
MDPDVAGQLIALVILLILSGFFSSAETAFTSLNKLRIRSQAEDGSKRAKLIYGMIEDPSRFLSTVLVGNNIVNIAASSLTTVFVSVQFDSKYIGLGAGILTLVILIFGEVMPKTIAANKAEKICRYYAPIIKFLMVVLYPITLVVEKISDFFFFIFRIDKNRQEKAITEDELLSIVDVSSEEGVLENDEREMINNVVDFGDTSAKDIMVTSGDMVCVPDDVTYEGLLEVIREHMYSRMPVYHETIDNITGVVWAKDILVKYDPNTPFDITKYMREAYFTYEFKNTRELMADMREEYKSMAIVLDEYGSTAGLITIEDLIEEIVGEIRDETDTDELDPIEKISDRVYIVEGKTDFDKINEVVGLSIKSDDYDSIAGHVIHLMKDIPESEGESIVDEDGVVYTVLVLEKNTVEKIMIELPDNFTPNKVEEKE